MEVQAVTKFARLSPTKARDLARKVQGLPVADALQVTDFSARKAAALIGKTLKSAIANAENNAKLAVDELTVKEAVVEEGGRGGRPAYEALLVARSRGHPPDQEADVSYQDRPHGRTGARRSIVGGERERRFGSEDKSNRAANRSRQGLAVALVQSQERVWDSPERGSTDP
jgi:large subunit ribosomal protein L22